MIVEKSMNSCQQSQKPKNNEKYFNYREKRYYARDYYLITSKKKLEDKKAIKKVKQAQWKRNWVTKKVVAAQSAN